MEQITITKDELKAALAEWDQERIEGKLLPNEEAAKLTCEERAQSSTEHLWKKLTGD